MLPKPPTKRLSFSAPDSGEGNDFQIGGTYRVLATQDLLLGWEGFLGGGSRRAEEGGSMAEERVRQLCSVRVLCRADREKVLTSGLHVMLAETLAGNKLFADLFSKSK